MFKILSTIIFASAFSVLGFAEEHEATQEPEATTTVEETNTHSMDNTHAAEGSHAEMKKKAAHAHMMAKKAKKAHKKKM